MTNTDYYCATHGIWNAARESGCPTCVIELRRANAKYRERLEIMYATDGDGKRVPFPEGAPDGISCRNETIRLLEDKNATLTAKCEEQAKKIERLTIRPQTHDMEDDR